jgi:hypothetical protein
MPKIDSHGKMVGDTPFAKNYNKRAEEFRQKERLVMPFLDGILDILIDEYNKQHENS